MLELNKIHCGDCTDVMQDIDSNSVDCIVTDPPYQLSSPNTKNATKGFMGKSWDICPSIEIWQECLRVLKPGAFTFVMCIPRQDCLARMICRLEDAGFNIPFSSIYWTYAVGFPKAQNLSKQADKRAGAKREVIGIKKLNPRDKKVYTPNSYKGLNGTSTFSKNPNMNMITSAVTEQAKALEGAYSGMQLKPAVEIVIVAMKPIEERTYLDQAMSNGHGCTWLDNARIPFESKDLVDTIKKRDSFKGANLKGGFRPDGALDGIINNKGRFPANVLCSDSVLNNGRVTKSTGGTGMRAQTDTFKGTEGHNHFHYGDVGSYSRYFSLDAWFGEHIKLLPEEAQKTFPWLIVPKVSKSEKNRGLEDMPLKEHHILDPRPCDNDPNSKRAQYVIWQPTQNNHPTCKPIKLMSWLITLASREGDIVLDPFCGSGTTAIAAKMLSRQYIGIEREEDYCEIARKRVSVISVRLDEY